MPKTPIGDGPQYREPSTRTNVRKNGSQYREPPARVNGRPTASGGANPYDLGNGSKPQHREDTRRVEPAATSGDKERPVHMTVKRAQAPVSAKREKHVSVRKALT